VKTRFRFDTAHPTRHINRMRVLGLSLSWLLLGCLLPGCQQHQTGSPADGQMVNGQYTNLYFKFTVRIPAGWSVSELKTIIAPPPGSTNAPSPGRDADAHQLLMLSEKPIGPSAVSNPTLLIMAEKTAAVPGVKSAKDYLARISQLMTDSPIAYRPVNGIADLQLGGAPAVRLDFSARLGHQKNGRQGYLVCQRENYMLSFILSGLSEEEIKRLELVLETIKFY
jgi:hypothetical protein